MSEIIDKLAEWIHEDWRRGNYSKDPSLDVPYTELSSTNKENNRAAARRVREVLALIGLGVESAETAKGLRKLTQAEIGPYIEAHIERLGEAEHNGWVAHLEKAGWSYGTPRADDRKLHPLMIPYSKLPESEKEKDRRAVRNYQAQLEAAGLAIVRL
jgi:RyR domain